MSPENVLFAALLGLILWRGLRLVSPRKPSPPTVECAWCEREDVISVFLRLKPERGHTRDQIERALAHVGPRAEYERRAREAHQHISKDARYSAADHARRAYVLDVDAAIDAIVALEAKGKQ